MKKTTISENIVEFRATKNPLYLAAAIILTIRQRRIFELVYGVYCKIFFRPSAVQMCTNITLQIIINSYRPWLFSNKILSRNDLVDNYKDDFTINSLPADFAGARTETIVNTEDYLIIGEYGVNAKRIIYISKESSMISYHYMSCPYVEHIHAVHKAPASEFIFVTTGDTDKFLDLWVLRKGQLMFVKTLKKRLAGYTAITNIGNIYYFGTDFSSRPNYIEKLDGKKFFFPEKAYNRHVTSFQQHLGRYILSINKDLSVFGGQEVLTIFDTVSELYIYCDYLDRIQSRTHVNL